MILKIERHNKEQQWWILDNIEKISCSKPSKGGRSEDSFGNVDISLLDHVKCNCDGEVDGCSDCIDRYLLICRKKDHTEFSVLFDTVAYLCNDNGKTIEKIVANYN
ncbi:MAG: hypothetical protein PVG65_03440 [Candidatus Thorarchaeota archaeon]|jgi:hypothetical protein